MALFGTVISPGLIGAGVLAVPVLTGSGAYAIAGLRQWRGGLDESLSRARGFYAVIAVTTVVAVARRPCWRCSSCWPIVARSLTSLP